MYCILYQAKQHIDSGLIYPKGSAQRSCKRIVLDVLRFQVQTACIFERQSLRKSHIVDYQKVEHSHHYMRMELQGYQLGNRSQNSLQLWKHLSWSAPQRDRICPGTMLTAVLILWRCGRYEDGICLFRLRVHRKRDHYLRQILGRWLRI